jgi:hypothetical protein
VKRLHWLDQLQYEARTLGLGPNHRSGESPLWLPKTAAANFPTCEMCNYQLLDSVEMVDESRTSITVLGKHHGAEDYFRVEFNRPPTDDDVRRALRSAILFRREHFEDDSSK